MKKAEKMNVSDRVMVLEYIGKHFSDYTEPGKGDLTYEMEYILCGKDTDKKNLESSIERLMRMREAANVAHIIADREKLNQTLMIATSLAGFPGIRQLSRLFKLVWWQRGHMWKVYLICEPFFPVEKFHSLKVQQSGPRI